jgi:hypothetical protein
VGDRAGKEARFIKEDEKNNGIKEKRKEVMVEPEKRNPPKRLPDLYNEVTTEIKYKSTKKRKARDSRKK